MKKAGSSSVPEEKLYCGDDLELWGNFFRCQVLLHLIRRFYFGLRGLFEAQLDLEIKLFWAKDILATVKNTLRFSQLMYV